MAVIKKLHGVVIESFLKLFIATFVVVIFIFVLQVLWLYADDLLGKALNIKVLTKMLFYQSMAYMPLALPVSGMLASIMTFGNMGEHFELTAVKSAGISLFKLMKPFFYIAIFFTIFSFYISNTLVPYSLLKSYSLIVGIRQQHPALRLQESIFNYDVEGYVIRIGKKNKETGMMYDFMIYDHKNYSGNQFVITADSGSVSVTEDLKFMIIKLYHGSQYEEMKEDINQSKNEEKKYPYHQDFFDKQTIIIPLKGFSFKQGDKSFFVNNYRISNYKMLSEKIDSIKTKMVSNADRYWKTISMNDFLRQQIKLRTKLDSSKHLNDVMILNKIPADSLKVLLNIDNTLNLLDLASKKNVYNIAKRYAENSLNRLLVYQSDIENRRMFLVQLQNAYNEKFIYALACIIFFFIGAPLGAIIRKGGFGLPTIISVLLFLLFYIILTIGERAAVQGKMTSFWGTWTVIFLYLPFEVYVFYKAATDSAIFNWDYYKDKLNKILKRINSFLRHRRRRRKIERSEKN